MEQRNVEAARSLLVIVPSPPGDRKQYDEFHEMVNFFNEQPPFSIPNPFKMPKTVSCLQLCVYIYIYIYIVIRQNIPGPNIPGQNNPDKIYPDKIYLDKIYWTKGTRTKYTRQYLLDKIYRTKYIGQNIPDKIYQTKIYRTKYTLSDADQLDVRR